MERKKLREKIEYRKNVYESLLLSLAKKVINNHFVLNLSQNWTNK